MSIRLIEGQGAGREIGKPLATGNIAVPEQRTFSFVDTSSLQQAIFEHWSQGELEDWVDGEKVDFKSSRIVLGCLLSGRRIEEVNNYLLRQKSSGTSGSRWLLNPNGGYNFNTMGYTPVLYLFNERPDLLYPATKEHLVHNILTIEGDGFTRKVPKLSIQDTENHILMAESSRYLKNQWLWENGEQSTEYDNKKNGVEEGLRNYLQEIYDYGMYEFNSAPYLGYSYSSLLILNAFAKGEIKDQATKILDRLNWQYALSSYNFKHSPPYRRKFGDAYKTSIMDDYHTVMLKVFTSLYSDTLEITIERGEHHALFASMLPYRPADKVVEWTLQKPNPYFVKIGHGYNSCPGIYSGDKDYLISAGGANQGKRSLIMPKPIMLFLDDEATDIAETFHLYGPGEDFLDWNNTGVYIDFACTKGQVHIPEAKIPLLTVDNWQIFRISNTTFLAVYSKNSLGILAIVRAETAEQTLELVRENNSDEELLQSQFSHPNGNFIEYDLDSAKDTWIIKSVNKKIVNRKFDRWPFFEGNIEELKYTKEKISYR